MKKISIIVPCYNAENCIDRCIHSLVSQTIGIENLELIFVDDASTDNTFQVLQKWEEQYPDSILLIHCEENGRQGRARNIGLSYAASKYIGFADHDDIAEPDMYAKMYHIAEERNCDLVVCRSRKHTMHQIADIKMGRTKEKDTYWEIGKEEKRLSFLNTDINRAIWNKLYRKELILQNEITFPEGTIYDDICFSELIKQYADRIYLLEEYLYHHIVSEEAASYNTKDWVTKLGWFDVQVIKIEELKKRGIYERYENRYQEEFMIDYIALVRNFINTYSYIPPYILNAMKNQTISMFPAYREIPAVREILSGKGSEFVKLACEGLAVEMDEAYVEKLVRLSQKGAE